MFRVIRSIPAILMLNLIVTGCAVTKSFRASEVLHREKHCPRILIIQPDIELSELTRGRTLTVNTEWTRQGVNNLTQAVKEKLKKMNVHSVVYVPPPGNTPKAEHMRQSQKLLGAVSSTIYLYHLDEAKRLPTKRGKFDWALGNSFTDLACYTDTDYALYLWVRDSYASNGRKAFSIIAAVALNSFAPGGIQAGHAMLVDLRTGEVVWFNALEPRPKGDLRTLEPARAVADLLLDGMPK